MKALLLIAHGSRRKQSNEEVINLAEKLHQRCSSEFPIIHGGFLELATPLIPDGIEQCINEGATSITVLPYFLNSGRHVVEDIPRIVDETGEKFPAVPITIAQHLGASDLMIDLLISSAKSATEITKE